MNKERLQERLTELNNKIEAHVKAHNEMVGQRDAAISESMAHHNMLIGQRNEVNEWLAKEEQTEA